MYAKKIEFGTKEYIEFIKFLVKKLNKKIVFDSPNKYELKDRIDEFGQDLTIEWQNFVE